MGVSAGQSDDARRGLAARRPDDPGQSPALRGYRGQRLRDGLTPPDQIWASLFRLLAVLIVLTPLTAQADPLRLAVLHTDLGRDSPGLLLRDIRRQEGDI